MITAQRSGVDVTALDINKTTTGAQEAAKAMYEICLEVPFLRILIDRRSKVVMNGLILGGFMTQVAASARAELNEKRPTWATTAGHNAPDANLKPSTKKPPTEASMSFSMAPDPAL